MDCSDSSTKHRWVCPSDRHLALRAKLRTGWSVKTQPLEILPKAQEPTVLDESEQAMILDVIRRAENIDLTEQERVGRLVDRVDNMKRNAMGNGTNQCILCGTKFGFLGSTSYLCHDCQKFVCSKCSIETCSSSTKEQIWLCKICSETREMWKKSGAWFFKGLPKYILPEKSANRTRQNMHLNPVGQRPTASFSSNWIKQAGGETENDSSSEDELMRRSRLNTGASIASAASAISAMSGVSGLSAASGASAVSVASSHSSVSASLSGSTVKAAIGNNTTTFGRDSLSRKSRHVQIE
ncbi:Rab effector Noc2 [Frankliniella fusca]|uniref:Rab effector Noc2 n=1 Tax=Frankliniella fusca TaxID=407009 RepID=A0AAE1HCR0_9NEOP|nr:Rab effector Noc2 [Frankliniella fusca]